MDSFIDKTRIACSHEYANCEHTVFIWEQLAKNTLKRLSHEALADFDVDDIAHSIQDLLRFNILPKTLMHELSNIILWEVGYSSHTKRPFLYPLINFEFVVSQLASKNQCKFTCHRVLKSDGFEINLLTGEYSICPNQYQSEGVDGYFCIWKAGNQAKVSSFTEKEMFKAHCAYRDKVLGQSGSKSLTQHILGMRALKMMQENTQYDNAVYASLLHNISRFEKHSFSEFSLKSRGKNVNRLEPPKTNIPLSKTAQLLTQRNRTLIEKNETI